MAVPPLSPRGTVPPPGEAWVYEHKNFAGTVWKVRGSSSNFQVQHSAPDHLGSLKLGRDTFCEVYNQMGYKGKSHKFEADTPNIAHDFDHKLWSMRVYEKGKEPPLSPRGPPVSPRGDKKEEKKEEKKDGRPSGIDLILPGN